MSPSSGHISPYGRYFARPLPDGTAELVHDDGGRQEVIGAFPTIEPAEEAATREAARAWRLWSTGRIDI